MTTIQMVLVALTAAILGFIILSNKKTPAGAKVAGVCGGCGDKSESLQNINNKLLCEKCSSVQQSEK